MSQCFPCNHTSPKPYDYHSMAMFSQWGELCDTHDKEFKAMTKPYVIKEPAKEEEPKKQFLPPPVRAPKDFHEREAGEEG